MSQTIQLLNQSGSILWQTEISDDEAQELKKCFSGETRVKDVGFLTSLCMPVRTYNIKYFAKDFFLPITLNTAIKVKSVILRLFAVLILGAVDLITFPLRLVTCIPRVIYNSQKKEHPLLKFLREKNVNLNFKMHYVFVKIVCDTDPRNSGSSTYKQGFVSFVDYPRLDLQIQAVNVFSSGS
ncbi:MAG: hypothetical protein VX777_09395 [Chlamydiota bacterium]|nr:hypothetical protein [Chlamydiota bacterium]